MPERFKRTGRELFSRGLGRGAHQGCLQNRGFKEHCFRLGKGRFSSSSAPPGGRKGQKTSVELT